MPPKDLGIRSAMKGFENGTVVKELSERGVERDEKGIVNTRMANVVTDGGDDRESMIRRWAC